jgi:sec-independent protein translocase protein TatA
MRLLEPWHLLIVGLLFVVLFGAKRLPDSAKALGQSLNIFKKAVRDPDGPQPRPAPPGDGTGWPY